MRRPGSTPLGGATQELADFAGISTTYEDAFGKMQPSAGDSVRAILGAMGFDASNEETAAASLYAARTVESQQTLAPIYVIAAANAPQFEIALRAAAAERTLHWSIAGEDGREIRGAVLPATLALAAAAEVGASYLRYVFAPPVTLAPGYYRLSLRNEHDEWHSTIAAVPSVCYLPGEERGRSMWGLATQLYALRSQGNWGIGDFADLGRLVETVRAAGGDAVGINPLHQLKLGGGLAPSPYSPSSRLFLNWMYLAIEVLPGFEPSDVDASELAALREPEFIEYDAVARVKRRVARAAYERFHAHDIADATPLAEEFHDFVRTAGERLRLATAFEVLSEHFAAELAPGAPWQTWPCPYRDPASPAVRDFIATHAREVEFCAYLQWQADAQLGAAARAASDLAIGLYRDLAVGADVSGADSWALQGTLKSNVAVGAPPDVLNRRGQNWGVAPFDPLALRAAAYEPFIALLRANMRHAGALRIDHVMALTRLYWIPQHAEPAKGAYVTYRLEEFIGLIALESTRHRCIVIGEDLGTVPDGLRERLSEARILSYRLLQFETDDERFFPPQLYPALALMCTGTHDLPLVAAYWTAHDVDVRADLGLLEGEGAIRREQAERALKRAQLLTALRGAGLSESDASRFENAVSDPSDRRTLAEIALWANRYLARAPGLLLMVQVEDVLGEIEQVNVPTTTTEHPNWRRRLAIEIDALASDSKFIAVARMLEAEGRGSVPLRAQRT